MLDVIGFMKPAEVGFTKITEKRKTQKHTSRRADFFKNLTILPTHLMKGNAL